MIHTHYPRERDLGVQIMEQEAAVELELIPRGRAVFHARYY